MNITISRVVKEFYIKVDSEYYFCDCLNCSLNNKAECKDIILKFDSIIKNLLTNSCIVKRYKNSVELFDTRKINDKMLKKYHISLFDLQEKIKECGGE